MNDSNRDVDKQPTLADGQLPVREHSDYNVVANLLRRYQNKRLFRDHEDRLYEELRDKERGCDDQ